MAEEKQKTKEELKDYEGGYGGGRNRVEQTHEHAFGERGWSTRGGDEATTGVASETENPEGVTETHGPDWQEKFVDQNADKYGQGGGHPIVQRSPSQSTGGVPEENNVGDKKNVAPRGGYGTRETEQWPDGKSDKDVTSDRK